MATTSKPQSRTASPQKTAAKPNKGPIVVHVVHANAVAINFSISSDALRESIPQGLTIDHYKGDTFVSLVCMELKRVPFCGLPIVPRFCELSLRCFVSERENPQHKGVYYLKYYTSSKFGSWVLGNLIPHQPQQLSIKANNKIVGQNPPELDYQWKVEGHDNRLRIRGRDQIVRRESAGKLEFILAHSSRYLSLKGQTTAYDVSRPKWVLWDAAQANFTCDVRRLFGKKYVKPLAARPVSVFLSAGSPVALHKSRTLGD
ncbi:MAG: DUF2071 domain-containing protein [Planctomycetota bacterium]